MTVPEDRTPKCPVHGTPMRVVEIGRGDFTLDVCAHCEQEDDDLHAFLSSADDSPED